MTPERLCTFDGCSTILSRYNPSNLCSIHDDDTSVRRRPGKRLVQHYETLTEDERTAYWTGEWALPADISTIADKLQDRFDMTRASALKPFWRMRREGHMTNTMRDKIAVALGTHPMLIWGERWYDMDEAAS